MREYGYTDHHLSDFEEDHLIPLELAGAPADIRNLWPEPHVAPGGWAPGARITWKICCIGSCAKGACRSPRRSGRSPVTGSPLTGHMQRRRREAPYPTGIVTVTAFVAVSMTDTVPEAMFAT
jgi:hypothetical protein